MVVTLTVPARPESLNVVRVVLMSCSALAGWGIEQLCARSNEVVDAFARLLMEQPDTERVVIRAPIASRDVDLVPVGETASAV